MLAADCDLNKANWPVVTRKRRAKRGRECQSGPGPAARPPSDAHLELPPHLARLVEAPLLSAKEERNLFRRMNELNSRASQMVASLPREAASLDRDSTIQHSADNLLEEARAIRDQLVQANIRLAIWVVKRFASARRPFDDLLSDGIMTIMRAVQTFDCERGVRFSTYACRALFSNTCRAVTAQAKRERRFAPWTDILVDVATADISASANVASQQALREAVATMVDRLEPREKMIVCGRYAVGPCNDVRSRESLANDLGVSKERVRQLQLRALIKLQAIAREMELDDD